MAAEHRVVPLMLSDVRRLVVAHDTKGGVVIESDRAMPLTDSDAMPGIRTVPMWITADGLPTNDNNTDDDGAHREISGGGIVQSKGTNFQYTDIAPGEVTPMHRTSSLDYNILIEGELILVLEDGDERHLRNPGDVVILKGAMHAWKNPCDEWSRWATVLIDAEPAIVNGNVESALI